MLKKVIRKSHYLKILTRVKTLAYIYQKFDEEGKLKSWESREFNNRMVRKFDLPKPRKNFHKKIYIANIINSLDSNNSLEIALKWLDVSNLKIQSMIIGMAQFKNLQENNEFKINDKVKAPLHPFLCGNYRNIQIICHNFVEEVNVVLITDQSTVISFKNPENKFQRGKAISL